ncbi:MAG: hypothetical protein H7246_21840 [Phycisphaerae bacterium]|nr:hypothetical protein [Saprospiraceae bacterium]
MKKLLFAVSLLTLLGIKLSAQDNGNFQWIMRQDGATTGQVLAWDGTKWAPASKGTVTSVTIGVPGAGITQSGSPITSSGTITLALANDLAALEGLGTTGFGARTGTDTWATRTLTGTTNKITITNGAGAAGDPVFDISATYPGQTSITTLGTITAGTWNGTAIGAIYGGTGQTTWTTGDIPFASATNTISKLGIGTPNQILQVIGGVPSWQTIATGGGTVTAFSTGNLSPLFTASVATSTTTPALSFALTNAAASTYFGNATGGSAAPSFTAAGALSKTDDSNVTLTLGGAPTTSLLSAVSLTLGWTGTLPGTRGGTGTGVTAVGDLLVGAASNTWNKLTIGSNNTFLKSNGTTASWSTLASTDLSNTANIALLNATQTFSGANTFSAVINTVNVVESYAVITTNTSTMTGGFSTTYLNVATAGSTVNLPIDANVSDGEILDIFNFNTNAIDIVANGANQNVNGGTQITDVPQYGHVTLKARIVASTINWMRWE